MVNSFVIGFELSVASLTVTEYFPGTNSVVGLKVEFTNPLGASNSAFPILSPSCFHSKVTFVLDGALLRLAEQYIAVTSAENEDASPLHSLPFKEVQTFTSDKFAVDTLQEENITVRDNMLRTDNTTNNFEPLKIFFILLFFKFMINLKHNIVYKHSFNFVL